jgi:hypothetical protein
LQPFGLFPCLIRKISPARGVNNAAGGVDQQPTIFIKAGFADSSKVAPLCSNAWNEQKMLGRKLPHPHKSFGVGGANHKHQVFGAAPFLDSLQHRFPEGLPGIFKPAALEVAAALVGSERQHDGPLAGMAEEWGYAVFAHIRRHGDGIATHLLEKCFGVHVAGVANVAALGIGDDQVLLADIFYRFVECCPAFWSKCFIKSQVGLVCHAELTGSIDDCLVERQDWIAFLVQVLGDFLQLGVESDTEEGFFTKDFSDEGGSVHRAKVGAVYLRSFLKLNFIRKKMAIFPGSARFQDLKKIRCTMIVKLKFFALFCIFSLFAASADAQPKSRPADKLSAESIQKLHGLEDTLAILAYAVVNDSIEQERFAACKVLITTLVRALKTENSYKYPFSRLKSVSILAPPDSSFRIFTWQLFVNDSSYRYYGAIQMNQKELKMYPLIDRSFEMEVPPTYEQLANDNWYGALYYNIRQFDSKSGRKYLLMGFDAFEFFDRRKVIEVLGFDEKGSPVFGASVFVRNNPKPGLKEQRLIFEYSAAASIRVNWDEQYKMILFDHLIPFPSPYGRGMTQVPDGSYDGLQLEKGNWKFIDKVFNDKQDEPPFPEPILDSRKGKDISGKTKKQ